jgi:hypothetical protein
MNRGRQQNAQRCCHVVTISGKIDKERYYLRSTRSSVGSFRKNSFWPPPPRVAVDVSTPCLFHRLAPDAAGPRRTLGAREGLAGRPCCPVPK